MQRDSAKQIGVVKMTDMSGGKGGQRFHKPKWTTEYEG